MHKLIEARRQRDNRKVHRCATCHQEWTYWPKTSCPGVPVVPWSNDHGHLRTRTQAKKERIVIPEDAQPVAALRGEKEYFWLYDIRECERNPLTEAQISGNEKREATIREKYGCPMCTYRYLAKDHAYFISGVCQECWRKARDWNSLIDKARLLVRQHIPILVLKTEPEQRMIRSGGTQRFVITGYQMYKMDDGSLIAERSLDEKSDYATLFGLLEMAVLSGTDVPLYLFPTEGDLGTFWEKLARLFGNDLRDSSRWGWDRLTAYLPLYQNIPLFPNEAEKGWRAFPDPMYQPQERYFADLATALNVDSDGPVGAVLSRIVRELASRPAIELSE